MSKRDERLAAKLREKQGSSYQSASDRAASKQSPTVTPGADATETYDAIRATPASAQRRASSKSSESVSRWRRSVSDEWNR